MTFVPRQLQLQYVPRLHVIGNLYVLESHIVASYTSEKFLLVDFCAHALCRFPVFKLPLVTATKHGHDPFPLRVAEALRIIIDIKSYFTLVYDPLDLDWLLSIG